MSCSICHFTIADGTKHVPQTATGCLVMPIEYSPELLDAAMLIKRMARKLKDEQVAKQAIEWLERKGLRGNILRKDTRCPMISERTKKIRECQADTSGGETFIVECRNLGSPDEQLAYESSQRDMEESVTQTPHASAAAECSGPTADRPLPEGHESGAGSAAPVKLPPEKCPRCGSTCRDLFLMPCNDDYWEKTHGADPFHYAARLAPAREWEVRDTEDYRKGFKDGRARAQGVLTAAQRVILDWHAWNRDNSGETVNWQSLKELEAELYFQRKAGAR